MRYVQHRSFIGIEGVLQHFLGDQVEVVGRLVEDQEVGFGEHEFGEGYTPFFAAAQVADPLEDLFTGKEEGGEQAPDLRVGHGRVFIGDFLENGIVIVENMVLLVVVTDVDVSTQPDHSPVRSNDFIEDTQDRGLAGPVVADQRHVFTAADLEGDAGEQLFITVGFGQVLENALNSYEGTVLYVSHDRYFINHTASRILSLTKTVLLNYPGNNSEKAPERFIGNYDFYLEKSAQVEEALLQDAYRDGQGVQDPAAPAPGPSSAAAAQAPASAEKLSWAQQKEEQARQRKAANDLRKCEDKIASVEKEIASLEEQMALPENYSDAARFGELTEKKEKLDEEFAALYQQWEELSENM